MAAATRALTPTPGGPFPNSLAPDTPTSISSQQSGAKSLAPAIAAAAALRASASPRSQISTLSTRASPQPLSSAPTEEQRRQREQNRQASPNTAVAALKGLLGQGQSGAIGITTQLSEPVAQMAHKIAIPESDPNDNKYQASPVSISSMGSIENKAIPATTAPTMAPAMPNPAENAYAGDDANTPRPAVDPGVEGPQDSRAFTYPPPPADDPRNPARGLSLPNSGYGAASPKSQGNKRHKCPYCSTVFTRHHNLKSHLLTHSQEKPYECQQCQSRFRRLHDLKRHTKLHTGERPHECPKCGRKFARGDALARHNKGQGGCAGRRSDFGLDEDGDGRVDDSMDGVEYTQEPEHMDEDGENGERRGSEVSRGGRQDSYRGGPSTYPPIGGRGSNVAQMYPPPPGPSNSDPQAHPSHISHFPQQPVFGQVTDSPKPISPGQTDAQRAANRPYQPPYNQGSGRGGATQLPPLTQTYGGMPPPGSGSLPGSVSSHSGSGGSSREILGSDTQWLQRTMETRLSQLHEEHVATMARVQSDHSRLENEYRSRIAQLESDNKLLQDSQKTLTDEIASLKDRLEAGGKI